MSSPGTAASLRAANQVRVVRALRQHQELSQADIARDTGLAPATVSSIVKDLVAAGLLTTTGGAGRRGATVAISRRAGLVGGVDFGHSHVQVSLGDLGGRVLVTAQEPLDNDHDHEDGLALAHRMLDRLLEAESDAGDLHAVGIGSPLPSASTASSTPARSCPAGSGSMPPTRRRRSSASRPGPTTTRTSALSPSTPSAPDAAPRRWPTSSSRPAWAAA